MVSYYVCYWCVHTAHYTCMRAVLLKYRTVCFHAVIIAEIRNCVSLTLPLVFRCSVAMTCDMDYALLHNHLHNKLTLPH